MLSTNCLCSGTFGIKSNLCNNFKIVKGNLTHFEFKLVKECHRPQAVDMDCIKTVINYTTVYTEEGPSSAEPGFVQSRTEFEQF